MRSQPKGRAYSTLLKEWKECLDLSPLEKVHFGVEIQALSEYLIERYIDTLPSYKFDF